MNIYTNILLVAPLLMALGLVGANGLPYSNRCEHDRSRAPRFTLTHQLPWPRRLRLRLGLLACRLLAGLRAIHPSSFILHPFSLRFRPRPVLLLANFNSAEHLEGKISYQADAAFVYNGGSQRFLVAMIGSDDHHINLCGVASEPLGICTDAPLAGETASVDVFGAAPGTKRAIAAAAITAGADLYTAANGLVQSEPAAPGTYWMIGRALHAATGAGDDLEFASCKPVKLVVIAALTSAPNATAAAVDLATSEVMANALKASFNALQADVAAIAAAAASPALIKIL